MIDTSNWVSVGSNDWSVISWGNNFSDWGSNNGFSDQWFFVDNSVESVDWISGVFNNSTASVSLNQRV
jgi:hypothetical protein